MKLSQVRKQVLRRFYESSFDRGMASGFEGATFDECVALSRVYFPRMSPWTVASDRSRTGIDFSKELARLGPEPEAVVIEPPDLYAIERLAEAGFGIKRVAVDAERLLIDRVKLFNDWQSVHRFSKLTECIFVLCKEAVGEPPKAPVNLENLRLTDCGASVVSRALGTFRAHALELQCEGILILDLSMLKGWKLKSLVASAGLLRGIPALAGQPLATLHLCKIHVGQELFQTLDALRGTLTELRLDPSNELLPAALPLDRLKKLTRLEVPNAPQFRAEWIERAVSNPDVAFAFYLPNERKLAGAIADIYREIEIVEVKDGKKQYFEVSGDFVDSRRGVEPAWQGSNDDLEAAVKKRIRAWKSKEKFTWGSESDTFVARAATVVGCKVVIDAILAP